MNDVFMTVTVSLRVTSSVMSAETIASRLSRVPSVKWSKGEAKKTPKGTHIGGVREGSYAVFILHERTRSWLSTVLSDCVAELAPHQSFLEEIRSAGGKTEFFVGWFLDRDGGDVLPPQLLLQIAELGLDLSLDVYPSRDETSE